MSRFSILACVAAVLIGGALICGDSAAQPRGYWKLVLSAPQWTPEKFLFADSDIGVLFAYHDDSSWCWKKGPHAPNFSLKQKIDVGKISLREHACAFPTRSDGYIFEGSDRSWITRDSGNTWHLQQYSNLGFPQFLRSANVFADGTGRMICYDAHDTGAITWETTDSAVSFHRSENEIIKYLGVPDAYCPADPVIWAIGSRVLGMIPALADTIWHSIDNGLTFRPLHAEPVGRFLWHFVESSDPNMLYVLSYWPYGTSRPAPAVDFLGTSDGGITWFADSSFGGARISHLFAASPNQLWAFIAKNAKDASDNLADTLYYSPDRGKHWVRDTTISGMTLLLMVWPDSTHGYLAAEKDSAMFIYNFTSLSAGVPEIPQTISAPEFIHLLTSPVRTNLKFSVSQARRVQITILDLLGRTEQEASLWPSVDHTIELNVEHLNPGVHVLLVGAPNTPAASTSFIKE